MSTLEEVEAKLAQKNKERADAWNKANELIAIAQGKTNEYQEILTEKYNSHVDMDEAAKDMYTLMQITEDAGHNTAAYQLVKKWVKSFDPHFLESFGRWNGDGLLPSAEITMKKGETPAPSFMENIARFSALVSGEGEKVVFSILDHTCGEFGSYYLLVSGENFDKGEVVDYYQFQRGGNDNPKPLKDALLEISTERWY